MSKRVINIQVNFAISGSDATNPRKVGDLTNSQQPLLSDSCTRGIIADKSLSSINQVGKKNTLLPISSDSSLTKTRGIITLTEKINK